MQEGGIVTDLRKCIEEEKLGGRNRLPPMSQEFIKENNKLLIDKLIK
jgi:hypothetical protein